MGARTRLKVVSRSCTITRGTLVPNARDFAVPVEGVYKIRVRAVARYLLETR